MITRNPSQNAEIDGNSRGVFDRARARFFLVLTKRAIEAEHDIQIQERLDCIGNAAKVIYEEGEPQSLWVVYRRTADNPYLEEKIIDELAGYSNDAFDMANPGRTRLNLDPLIVREEVADELVLS